MAEPTNPSLGKKLDAVDSTVKELNFRSLNKKWGDVSKVDGPKDKSTNGLDPYQEADQDCAPIDFAKVDNDNKLPKTAVPAPKKEASNKFKSGDLDIGKLNEGEWGYTGKESGKKKAGAGKGKFNG